MANNFNPRSPRGERLLLCGGAGGGRLISTHAPRKGSDLRDRIGSAVVDISTHAPREGSDSKSAQNDPVPYGAISSKGILQMMQLAGRHAI